MRVSATLFSLLLHLAIILLLVFGLPNFFAPEELEQAIAVQMVNISDVTTQTEAPTPAPPAPEPPKPEPPKPAPPQPETPPPPPTPPPPTPEPPAPAPQPVPEPPPAPEPEPVPEPVIAPPEPEPVPEPEPEPEPEEVEQAEVEPPPPAPPKKPEPPRQVAEVPDEPEPEPEPEPDIASVLKNVEELAQRTPEEAQPVEQPTPQTASQAPLGTELSISERDAIRQQIEQCWIVDPGMRGIEDLVVTLHVEFNPDGSIHRVDFADPMRLATDQSYRVLAERARAAVLECSPLRVVSAQNYASWKSITFRFNPRGMLGL